MVGRLLSFGDGIFSGVMLNFQGLFVRGIYFIINSRVNGRLDLQDYFHEAKGLEQTSTSPNHNGMTRAILQDFKTRIMANQSPPQRTRVR